MLIFSILQISKSLVYRTNFLEKYPMDFDQSLYKQTIIKKISNKTYKCFIPEGKSLANNFSAEIYIRNQLSDLCFEFTHTGYWFFKFCPFNSLTQYRFGEDLSSKIDIFTLGREKNNEYKPSSDGVITNWGHGDTCFVTKKPRTTKVEFICDLSLKNEGIVTSISEPSYCNYLVKFHTQHACAYPNSTSEILSEITCINNF